MIRTKKDLKKYLQEDKLSLGISYRGIFDFIFPNPIWTFQKTLRHLEYYSNCRNLFNLPLWIIYKIKYRRLSLKLGFTIPINVIDAGLSISHYGTIIISPFAKIGKNVRIHACVNIGASGGSNLAPQIGDNVYIGPGALLFGGIIIGDCNTIGANATVNSSFTESNIVIAGTPAKVVKRNARDWTIFNKRCQQSK